MRRLGRQPRRRRGTIERPFTALDLRLVLAMFGLITCAILAAVAWARGYEALGWALAVLAAVAFIDAVVVQLRRHS